MNLVFGFALSVCALQVPACFHHLYLSVSPSVLAHSALELTVTNDLDPIAVTLQISTES